MIDEKELELFPKCQSCTKDRLPGIFFCVIDKCPNLKKYCCLDCLEVEGIHDHRPKKTQAVIDEVVRDYKEKWQTLRANVEQLVTDVKPKFTPHEALIRHLESIANQQEERKGDQPQQRKKLANDYKKLIEFQTFIQTHVSATLADYVVQKKAFELLQEVANYAEKCQLFS